MSKAILGFNLPEEKDDFTAATKGMDYYLCLWDLHTWLRNQLKYNGNTWAEMNGYEVVQNVRDKFFEILGERNCSLEDIS